MRYRVYEYTDWWLYKCSSVCAFPAGSEFYSVPSVNMKMHYLIIVINKYT